MENRKFIALGLVAFLFTVFWYKSIFFAPFSGESISALTINQNPFSSSTNYLIHLFKDGTINADYSPLSDLSIFYFGRKLLGLDTWKFHFLGLVFMFSAGALLWRFLTAIFRNQWIATPVTFAYLIHPSHFYNLSDISIMAKFYFPLMVLLLGLHWIYDQRYLLKPWKFTMFSLALISMLWFEGAWVIPLVWVTFDICIKRKWQSIHTGLFLLSLGFAFTHDVILKSQQPVLNVYWKQFGEVSSYFMSHVFGPYFAQNSIAYNGGWETLGLIMLLGWLFYSLYAYIKSNSTWPLFTFLTSLLLILPFMQRGDYIRSYNANWAHLASCFLFAFLAYRMLKSFEKDGLQKWAMGLILFILSVSVISAQSGNKKVAEYLAFKREAQTNLLKSVNFKIADFDKDEVIKINLREVNHNIMTKYFPALLAKAFPNRKFIIYRKISEKKVQKVFVFKGSYYFKYNIKNSPWMDSFKYKLKIKNPKPTQTIEIFDDELDALS